MPAKRSVDQIAREELHRLQTSQAATGAARAKDMNRDPARDPGLTPGEAVQVMRAERRRREEAGMPDPSKPPPAVPEIEDDEDLQDPIQNPERPLAGSTAVVEGAPEWCVVPAGLAFPRGWQVYFVRFPADQTSTPREGVLDPDGKRYRQAILWNLSESDEKFAARRARGDGNRLIDEMTKNMIRAVDGVAVDWTLDAGPGSVRQWWTAIGGKCRHQLKSLYIKTHTMDEVENKRFFEECITQLTVG